MDKRNLMPWIKVSQHDYICSYNSLTDCMPCGRFVLSKKLSKN